jgi:small subunit ribosomal protein S1
MITCVLLPYTFRVSTFDPVDRDEHGAYIGVEDVRSDHARVEAAYLAAVAAFARDSGVDRLVVREPSILVINFGVEPAIDGYGLAGLFADPGDYHDGAQVPIGVAVELVRGMLRDNGAWCRLEVEDRFFVHVGYDQYVYIGSTTPCGRAAALTRDSGLFAEPVDGSPLAADFDDQPPGGRRPADTAWWAALDRWSHSGVRG